MLRLQDTDDMSWSRVGELAAAGQCPCFCSNWAELHVRSPTGDVCWVMRMQNQVHKQTRQTLLEYTKKLSHP